ncbi:MAG: hypothetical protein ABIP13_10135, partial [Tepidiformaceae bacterium]
IEQAREMGWFRFYVSYFIGQFRCRFQHSRHPLEIPAIDLQRLVVGRLRDFERASDGSSIAT